MSTNFNSLPRLEFGGIRDDSRAQLPQVPEMFPKHFPHVFLFAKKGSTSPQVGLLGRTLVEEYGAETFDLRSDYATHQTVLANIFNENANAMQVQRLQPEDAAPPATLFLSLEIVKTELPVYSRDEDGRVQLDEDGNKVVVAGEMTDGHQARWVVTGGPDAGDFGEREASVGSLVGAGDIQSQVIPIMDLEASSFGEWGNGLGIRLSANTTRTRGGMNQRLFETQGVYPFTMQVVERQRPNATPVVVEYQSARSVEFALKESVEDDVFGIEYGAQQRLKDAYGSTFGGIHVYQDNIDSVLADIFEFEQPHQYGWQADEDKYRINLVSGLDHLGNQYHSFEMLGAGNGAVNMTSATTHYCRGGSDGTMTPDTFAQLVKHQLENWGKLEHKLLDRRKYPGRFLWDTGFPMDVKNAMDFVMGSRPDIITIKSTQDVMLPRNSTEQTTSAALALRTAARMYPESEIHGTSTCRSITVGGAGELLNSRWNKGILPYTLQLAHSVSRMMGAGNGIFAREYPMDVSPNNQLTLFKPDNELWRDVDDRSNDWNNGLVFAQYYDSKRAFFPAVRTVYDDDTSVLNSFVNVVILTDLIRISDGVWADLVGRADLTPEEFLQESDELIGARADASQYADRCIIESTTYFTEMDKVLGYKWSTDITVYLNNMMLVGELTIASERRARFAGN